MGRFSQVGIAVGILGGVIAFIGLFPASVGLEVASGIGVLQVLVIVAGMSIMISGAVLYVQTTYYAGIKHNLAQQIGIRLSATGLVISLTCGLADVFGFGSHLPTPDTRPFLGTFQIAALIGGFIIASVGVLIFALFGDQPTES
jgi:hypothetical protein